MVASGNEPGARRCVQDLKSALKRSIALGIMARSLIRIAISLGAAAYLVTLLRGEEDSPPALSEPFSLELFEAVRVDGSVLLRVAGHPMPCPRLVLDGPLGERVLEPLPTDRLPGAAIGFAAGADDVAAARAFTLRTDAGATALPAPAARVFAPPVAA